LLNFYSNNIIGSLPSWLAALPSLNNLALGLNSMTGTLPAWLGNWHIMLSIITLMLIISVTEPNTID